MPAGGVVGKADSDRESVQQGCHALVGVEPPRLGIPALADVAENAL
jgi:hypothetical protein